MAKFKLTRRIERPRSEVFRLFTDFDEMPGLIDKITSIEMLTEGPPGKGTRFRETRKMFGKQATEEMEITDFQAEETYTCEADSHGMHYRSVYQFEPVGHATDVNCTFEARPVSLAARIFLPLTAWLTMGTTKKIFARDIEDLKEAAERREQ